MNRSNQNEAGAKTEWKLREFRRIVRDGCLA